MTRTIVLMSTYNGEKYLKEQLDTLLQQSGYVPDILIRDDGSTDGTKDILRDYVAKKPNISVYCEKNIGVIGSFLSLIKEVDLNAYDYFAFCDQDDFWQRDKLKRAIRLLEQEDARLPLLYCSNITNATEMLEPISKAYENARPSFENALVHNICTGCTAVMNRKLIEILRLTSPERIVMHDWWFYLVASAFGKVIFDEESRILYRQHQNNVHGSVTSKKEALSHYMARLSEGAGTIYPQLREFKKIFDKHLTMEQQSSIDKVLSAEESFLARLKLAFDKNIYRTPSKKDFVYRIAVILGKL